jgi:hypothetical protein
MTVIIGIFLGWFMAIAVVLAFFHQAARRNAEYDRQLREWMEQQK